VDSGDSVFLFGFEESYGYLVGDFVRDKDGVQASQLVAEMAAYYKTHEGMTLLDALEQLWQRFGYYQEELVNLELAENELDRVERIMNHLRFAGLSELKGVKILRVDDYLQQSIHDLLTDERFPTGLPASNSLKYFLEGDAWFCIRPSGTEPKLKIYLGVREGSMGQAAAALSALKDQVMALVNMA
jgi:phosphoglucomutase